MFNATVNAILRGYAVRKHRDTGILIAEKQIFLPQKEIVLLDQCPDMVWNYTNGIILTDDRAPFLKGGRSL